MSSDRSGFEKQRAEELKASGRGGKKKADDLESLLAKIAKIAEMPDEDRVLVKNAVS